MKPEMKLTGVMHFDNRPHLTYTLGDTEYISMRSLVDQIGLDWRTQKKGLLDDDSVLFYGTLALEEGNIVQPPCKYDLKNGLSASYSSAEGQKIATFCTEDAQKDTLFIRLKRVYMYLARISIGHVKGTGKNHSSAEYLLYLQEEWADALHSYETVGMAVKQGVYKETHQTLRNLLAVTKEKRMTDDKQDRQVLSSIQKDLADKIGFSYQQDLLDD